MHTFRNWEKAATSGNKKAALFPIISNTFGTQVQEDEDQAAGMLCAVTAET